MTSPAFNDPFNTFYDQYSVNEKDIAIPDHFDSFLPDNQEDYKCIMVISPSLLKGASRWTKDGKWITIGIYRDEGRAPAQRPLISNLSWSRTGTVITVTNTLGHMLHVGDLINLYNISQPDLLNISVNTIVDAYNFSVNCQSSGDISGNFASYQENFITNFYETNRVFRLLPSFKLIPYSEIQNIFTSSAPPQQATRRTLYNITSSQDVNVPGVKNSSVNYELPTQSLPKDENINLQRRFSQVYDETGQPLKLTYDALGLPVKINNVDSPFKNDQIFYNDPVDPLGDPYIYVYDYYGLEINDILRGPYHSTLNVVRDLTISESINNLTNNITALYNSMLNDAYANLAIGVQQNNALVVRKQILPIALDIYNRPVKNPLS
jgi:hypothetical protein